MSLSSAVWVWVCRGRSLDPSPLFFYDLPPNALVQTLHTAVAQRLGTVDSGIILWKPREPLPEPVSCPDHLEVSCRLSDHDFRFSELCDCISSRLSGPIIEVFLPISPGPVSAKRVVVLIVQVLDAVAQPMTLKDEPRTVTQWDADVLLTQGKQVAIAVQGCSSPPPVPAKADVLREQTSNRVDVLYNGRPLALSAPFVGIYHPAFARFIHQLATHHTLLDPSLSHEELDIAHSLITASSDLHASEVDRLESIRACIGKAINGSPLRKMVLELRQRDGRRKQLIPYGSIIAECPLLDFGAIPFLVETNEGNSAPYAQASCDYATIYTSKTYDPIAQVSCCPAFLLGIAGSHMIISGAAYTDQLIVQDLTPYITLGSHVHVQGRSGVDEGTRQVAQVLRALKLGIQELRIYYQALDVSVSHTLPVFPHFDGYVDEDGMPVKLVYFDRLARSSSHKAVYQAGTRRGGQEACFDQVTVKFAHRYCPEAHDILARLSPPLAPRLLRCTWEESVQMYVVIMEFVRDVCLDDLDSSRLHPSRYLTAMHVSALRTAMQTLHKNGYVFGDLRPPNIMLVERSVKLVDFDWCGRMGEARYPSDINLSEEMGWHDGVRRGGVIEAAHDQHLFTVLTRESF